MKKLFLTIIGIILLMSIVDLALIFLFKTSPLFAIKINVYKDGGSKEYYGIGYKTIKCNTLSGDNKVHIGFYNMNINNVCKNEPLTIDNSEFTIVNETSVCNNVAEPFYDDAKYHYLFECERSNTTFVKFIDGTKMSIKDALNDNLVTILQIQDKLKTIPNNKIKIIKKLKIDIDVNPSNKCETKPMITKEMSSTYKAMDYNLYTYCLDELNITIDNEKFNLRDALATGEVDLENIVDYMEFGSKWAEATKEEYDDGAVKYSNLKFSLLKCNNDLNEYYIGKNDMSYDKIFCK